MSHFCVLVIGDNVDERMEPYQENNMDTVPPEFLEFVDETEEVEAAWKDYPLTVLGRGGSEEDYKNIQEYAEGYWGYEEQDGRYGRTCNTNAKWDWYEEGGRWGDYLPLKDGNHADSSPAKDVDLAKLEPTFAVLNDNGWHEIGSMGWFGTSHGNAGEKEWERAFRATMDDLHPDTLITVIDCHI